MSVPSALSDKGSSAVCDKLTLCGCAHARELCVSDQWNVQSTMQRTNDALIERGYVTWFDLTNMKGSTMDAMSDAIEG